MLNTMYEADDRPPAPDPARTAAHRDTTFYFGCADVRYLLCFQWPASDEKAVV